MMNRILVCLWVLLVCVSVSHAQATNYCNNQIYQTFEGGTTGAVPTAAQLQASSMGLPGSWLGGFGTVTYSSVDMPALVAPGRLCGDGVTYSNSPGQHGLQLTGDGGVDFYYIQYNFPTPTNLSDATVTFEYNEDFNPNVDPDNNTIDAVSIGNDNDGAPSALGAVAFNAYGSAGNKLRYISLEVTGGSQPNITWTPSTQCPCKIILHYQNGSSASPGTMNLTVLDKNGALIHAFSQVGPSGGPTYTHAHPTFVRMGDVQNGGAVTSGRHAFFDNLQISFNTVVPGKFCAGASPTWTSSPDDATLLPCINGLSSGDTLNVLSGTATWATQAVNNFANKVPMNIIGQTTITGAGTASPSASDTTPGSSTVINATYSGNGAAVELAVPMTGCPTPTSTIPCTRLSGFTFNLHSIPNSNVIVFDDATTTWPPPPGRFRADNLHIVAPLGSGTGDMLITEEVAGVIDHNWFQNHAVSTIVHIVHFGDALNKGFSGWNTPLALGTDQAVYVETNSFTDDFCNTSGAGDGNQGARAVYRHNYELNGHIGFHGTDSGGELSMFSFESYGNTWENRACTSTGLSAYTSRGGTFLAYNDSFIGSAPWGAGKMQQLRADPSTAIPGNSDWSNWGGSNGIPWYVNGFPPSGTNFNSTTTSGPDWTASHSYTCSQAAPCVLLPTPPGNINFVSFTSGVGGTSRPTWNTTAGATTPDGSMSWINQQGFSSTGVNAQRCPLNKDVFVTSVLNCPAGDQTGTLGFFDGPSSAFGYPGANQIGRSNQGPGTGETLNPVYQWSNTGLPSPGLFVQNDPTGNFIHECRDYYQQQGAGTFTGACAAGVGVGVGTLAARPVCSTGCSLGVGYWDNVNNKLYTLTAPGVWTLYYVPLVYPHPLVGGGPGSAGTPSFSVSAGTYTTPQTVSITSSPSTVICYNTTGSPHTNGTTGCTAGTLYSGAVTVSAPETLYAVGGGTGFTDSAVASATYSFVPGLAPSSFSFGSVQVGAMGAPQSFILSNYTGVTITNQGATFATGTNYGLNNPGSTCSGTLPTSSTCTISVIFAPTNTGLLTDTLQANFTGASGSPAIASLSGTGTPATVPALPTAKALIAKNLAACPVCTTQMQPCLCFTMDQNIYVSTGGAYSLFASLVPPVTSVNGHTGAVVLKPTITIP